MKKIIVFGNQEWAELVYFFLTHDSSFEVAGFTVDSAYINGDSLFGLPIVPFEQVEVTFPPLEYSMLIALSYQRLNRLREEKYYQAKSKGYELVTFISSKSITWNGLIIGDNCLVCENSSLNPFVRIGDNVTIGANVLIGHHAVIKDHCFISPGAVILGSVTVEPYCLVGAGSTIKEKVKIASNCVIGAGVTITKDTKEKGVYIEQSPEALMRSSDSLRTWISWSGKQHKPTAVFDSKEIKKK